MFVLISPTAVCTRDPQRGAAGAQPNAVYGTLLKNSTGHFSLNTIPKRNDPVAPYQVPCVAPA
jgi:hypothetical protein